MQNQIQSQWTDDCVILFASSDQWCNQSGTQLIRQSLEQLHLLVLQDIQDHGIDFQKFNHLFRSMKNKMNEMLDIAKLYSFQGLDINGFSVIAELFVDFLAFLHEEDYFAKVSAIHDVTSMLRFFDSILNMLHHLHELKKEFESSMLSKYQPGEVGLVGSSCEDMHKLVDTRNRVEQELEVLFEKFFLFWLREPQKQYFQFLLQLMALGSTNFFTWNKVLDTSFLGRRIHQITRQACFKTPFRLLAVCDSSVGKKFQQLVSYNSQVKSTSISIPAQTRWIIPDQGVDIIENKLPTTTDRVIPCRLLVHASKPNTKKMLIIHIHGGAFLFMGSEMHEIYTKPFVAGLEGATILCPDYSQQVRYPIQFQEILDVYLWVISDDPLVEKVFGFKPESINFLTDSAGAVLTLALLHSLDRIHEKDKKFHFSMPNWILFIYPALFISVNSTPSRFHMIYDAFMNLGMMLGSCGVLFGPDDAQEPVRFSGNIVQKMLQKLKKQLSYMKYLLLPQVANPWYLKNDLFDEKTINKILSKIGNSLLNTTKYLDLEKFSDISIYIMTCSKCPFLDESVDMARLWKGYVELHVLKDEMHGNICLPGGETARRYTLNILKRILGCSKELVR